MFNLRRIAELANIHKSLVNSDPKLRRGMVWCTVCGRSLEVDSALCLGKGWPKCCGQTMTIDSPEERHCMERDAPQRGAKRGAR